MPPFTPKEVTRYLLWIALIVLAVIVLTWYLMETPAHEPIQPKHGNGASVRLSAPILVTPTPSGKICGGLSFDQAPISPA